MPTNSHRTRRGSPLHITPSFELFSKSKRLVLDHIWIFGPLYAFPMLYLIHSWLWNIKEVHGREHLYLLFQNRALNINTPGLPQYDWGYFLGFLSLTALVMIALSVIVQIMTQAAQLDAAENRVLDFAYLWRSVKRLGWRLLGLYIISSILIGLGLVLLIIPGLMVLRRIYLAPYVMLDEDLGIEASLRRSSEITGRNPGSVWGVIGVMFLIGLISVVPFIGSLASFILAIFYSVAPAIRYLELKRLS